MADQRHQMALKGLSRYAFVTELQENTAVYYGDNIDKKCCIVLVNILSFSLCFITCIGYSLLRSEANATMQPYLSVQTQC